MDERELDVDWNAYRHYSPDIHYHGDHEGSQKVAACMDYRVAFLVGLITFGVSGAWIWLCTHKTKPLPERTGGKHETAWKQVNISFVVFALVFLAFDMEMIFMFPWAVAFHEVGTTAFWDMFVFAGILGAALIYAGKRGGFRL